MTYDHSDVHDQNALMLDLTEAIVEIRDRHEAEDKYVVAALGAIHESSTEQLSLVTPDQIKTPDEVEA